MNGEIERREEALIVFQRVAVLDCTPDRFRRRPLRRRCRRSIAEHVLDARADFVQLLGKPVELVAAPPAAEAIAGGLDQEESIDAHPPDQPRRIDHVMEGIDQDGVGAGRHLERSTSATANSRFVSPSRVLFSVA